MREANLATRRLAPGRAGRGRALLLAIAAVTAAAALGACGGGDGEEEEAEGPEYHPATPPEPVQLIFPPAFECKPVKSDPDAGENQFPVPKPPFSKDIFPCTRCHDKPDDFNMTPRTLTAMHSNIKLVHGSRQQWCYDCHNPTYRDKLRLAGGALVSFDTSYELCGQCHGEKLRDWRAGIHGRRTGCWNGKRQYLLCVNCHNPHSPHFKPLRPRLPPKRPGEIEYDPNAGSEP